MSLLSDTHSDRLAARVTELLGRGNGADGSDAADGAADRADRADRADGFREIEERALRLKAGFYDQFLPALDPSTTA
ncbi:hypothetical protein ACODT5_35470 [Streptomyces sp. 5.8]|uniref:hypothetical protein n=1 Tax=Streptomyces sp. 5.8 TaxID=3406571 RepID=UPI003BB7BDC1